MTYTFTTFLVSIRDLGQYVLGCDLAVHNIGAIRHNAGNGKGALDLVDRYFVLEDELGDEGYSALAKLSVKTKAAKSPLLIAIGQLSPLLFRVFKQDDIAKIFGKRKITMTAVSCCRLQLRDELVKLFL